MYLINCARVLRALPLLLVLVVVGLKTVPAPAGANELIRPTVLITGSNRGIGFAIAKIYAKRGWGVIATCRDPGGADELRALADVYPSVVIEQLDVTDYARIDELAGEYRDTPIDILINNAGILGGNDRQQFGRFDYAAFDDVMAVNARAPLKMVEAFIDHIAASEQKKIMNISSLVGSIEMTFGGQNFYRASKAALNMSMRTIAKELKRADEEARRDITVGLIDPGVVDTGFAKNVPIPMITAGESAAGVVEVIDNYTLRESGSFMRYDGKPIPW